MVTNLWPGRRRPAWGSFVANRVDALRRLGHDVSVVAVDDHPSAILRYAGLAAKVARRLLAPGELQGVDVVEAHIAYPTGLFAYPLARRLGARYVVFAHGSDVLRVPDRSPIDARLSRWVFDNASLVIANTDYLAGELVQRMEIRPDRITVVAPGIRFQDFAAVAGVPKEIPLLFVGNLIHRKAVDVVLEALRQLPDPPPLRIVGDGVERAALESAADGLDVTFAGAATQEEVAAEMGRARVLLVPSREEALGLVALEGMAAGCLVVASDVGGLGTLVREGETGFTAPAEDPRGLGDAIVRALTTDEAKASRIVEAGVELARHHDVDAVTAQTVEALRADRLEEDA